MSEGTERKQQGAICRAEIVAIGDELTSGQRLDTNSQWISQQLGDLGIEVAFHTTVGDSLSDNVEVLQRAAERVDLVVTTGGLGPTADDLTRQVCAELAAVELEFDQASFDHIESIFRGFGRTMPENNRIQACFPSGAEIIPNRHGTAPAFSLELAELRSIVVALPGVPAELKEIWRLSVERLLNRRFGIKEKIFHHAIHLFGRGESDIQEALGEVLDRDREPLVGITASQATITLRIQQRAENKLEFRRKISDTLELLYSRVGEVVFGEQGQTLQFACLNRLKELGRTMAIVENGNGGQAGHWLGVERDFQEQLKGCLADCSSDVAKQCNFDSDYTLRYEVASPENAKDVNREFAVKLEIVDGVKGRTESREFSGSSHPAIRQARVAKWVLDQFYRYLKDA